MTGPKLPQSTPALRDRLGIGARTAVVGIGASGFSCARFLHRLGLEVALTDTRAEPPCLEAVRRELPEVPLYLGGFSREILDHCDQVIVSPGLSLRDPALEPVRKSGKPILGDIELFARCADAPVIAITGSNGKSTVTALVGEMARRAGRDVRVGGNIGTPALDLLDAGHSPDLYVLELSSFQLETTRSLEAHGAALLNISADHLDRYRDLEEYLAAKLGIYRGRGVRVVNRDDPRISNIPGGGIRLSFGSTPPGDDTEFGLRPRGGSLWLARGDRDLLPVDELGIRGRHNALNALAALALGCAADLPEASMLQALRVFPGLPHRMQWLGDLRGVSWYNDSKGTNVGATLAAIGGLDGQLVLIAGGIGKGQDFSPLRDALSGRARAVLLIGADAGRIEDALGGGSPVERHADLPAAVRRAAELARPGDSVVLSPACASFDMFDNYEDRGRCFIEAVGRLPS